MFLNWKIYNKGINQREAIRIINKKYNPELRRNIIRKGYTPDEFWEAHQEYLKENRGMIKQRRERSLRLKEQINGQRKTERKN